MIASRTPLAALAAAMLSILLAAAATAEPRLRPVVEVDGAVVTLGHLFESAGEFRDVPAFNAPPVGETVTLDIPRVFELANARGMAWRPVAPFDRVTVRRAARSLSESDIRDAVVRALRDETGGNDFEIDVHVGSLDIMVPRGALVDVAVDRLDYDPADGRFRATLAVTPSGGGAQHYTVAGRAHSIVEVPVLRERLRPDTVIRSDDIVWRKMRSDRLRREVVTDAADLVGMSPRRTIVPGRALARDEVGPPILVRKGETVTMRLKSPQMELTAVGRALDSGADGDVIAVQNTDSRIVVEALVAGTSLVVVAPGSRYVSN